MLRPEMALSDGEQPRTVLGDPHLGTHQLLIDQDTIKPCLKKLPLVVARCSILQR